MKSVALVLALGLLAPLAFAHEGKRGKERHEKLRQELNLTPEQEEKMTSLRQQQKKAREEKRAQVDKAQAEFRAAMDNPKSTDAELTKKFEVLEKAQAEMRRSHFTSMLAVRGILNEEQRVQFNEKRSHWRERREGRRNKKTSK